MKKALISSFSLGAHALDNIFGCWRPVTDEQAAILDAGNFSGGGLYKFYWMHFTDEGWAATRRGVCIE